MAQQLAVEVHGTGDPVILAHGLGGTSNVFTPQVGALSRFFQCVRFDLPGSGRSPADGDLSIAGFADTIVTVLEARGIARAHVVGHSLGTVVCQQLAVRHPERVRSLALIGPLHAPPEAARPALRDRAAKARAVGIADSHMHLSWNNQPTLAAIQQTPPEEHVLFAADMAKLVLDAVFTSGFGAAAAKPRLDVVIRNAINAGQIPGPRYRAAGQEIATPGGLGDTSPPHIEHEGLNFGTIVSGPEEVRRVVRRDIKYGVDNIKLNLSGEEITGVAAEVTPMARDEIAMAVSEATAHGKTLCAHARSSESVNRPGKGPIVSRFEGGRSHEVITVVPAASAFGAILATTATLALSGPSFAADVRTGSGPASADRHPNILLILADARHADVGDRQSRGRSGHHGRAPHPGAEGKAGLRGNAQHERGPLPRAAARCGVHT